MSKHHPWSGYFLAALGIAALTAEAGLHIYGYFTHNPYELNTWVLLILTVIGFVGFYLINPKGTDLGSDILTKRVVAIISVLRGSKASEASVEVTPVKEGVPDPSAAVIVTAETPIPDQDKP